MNEEGRRAPADVLPIPLVLACPRCKNHHLDEGEWATRWHQTHLCASCVNEWTPYPFPTVGVAVPRMTAGGEVDRWRAARPGVLSFMVDGSVWENVDQTVHDAVYRYMLRVLLKGHVPSLTTVVDALQGTTKVPGCGYLGCDFDQEHVH